MKFVDVALSETVEACVVVSWSVSTKHFERRRRVVISEQNCHFCRESYPQGIGIKKNV